MSPKPRATEKPRGNLARRHSRESGNPMPRSRFADLVTCVADTCHPSAAETDVYVGLEHIDSGAFELTRFGHPDNVMSAKSRFRRGDILYGKLRPYLDKAVLADREGICSTDILVFRPKTNVAPVFALGIIHSEAFRENATATTKGVNHPRTSWNGVASFECFAPPPDEQEKIAAVLWKLQRAIATQDRLIAATGDLKQSAMQRLFTHGLRGEALKDTEIGPIPASWKIVKGVELFKLTSGALRPKELSPVSTKEKPYPVLGGNGIMGYADSYLVDEQETVVIGRVGEYCGATHLVSGKVWITDNALYVKQWLYEDADGKFVAQYLSHYDLNRFKRQAGQPLVTQGTINELSFAMPAPSEQRDIAAALATIDRKLAHHRAKRAALDALFQTTLHQLMTAQVRVADLDIDTSEVAATAREGEAA